MSIGKGDICMRKVEWKTRWGAHDKREHAYICGEKESETHGHEWKMEIHALT